MSMTDLLNQLSVDDDYNYDPESYNDGAPKLLDAGTYLVRVKTYGLVTTRDGILVKDKDERGEPRYPILKLDSVDILEPEDTARTVYLFQRLRSKPFMREDREASAVLDMLRAFDQTRRPSRAGVAGTLAAIDECVQQGMTMRVRLDWVADDYAGAKEAIQDAEARGVALDAAAKNKIYDEHRLRKQARFPLLPNGKRSAVWTSPSGTVVQAKLEVVRFIPSMEQVALGPFNRAA